MLARLEYIDGYSLAVGYFMTFCVSLHQCSGSLESGGSHTQITSTLQRMPFFQVQTNDYKEHNGLISKVCEKRFSASKVPTLPHSCWRVKEGKILCPGKRQDMQDMVVSIPVILAIEVGDESVGLNHHLVSEHQNWDFPPTISPDSENAAKKFDVIYDLVGFVLINTEGTHFTARYSSHNQKIIYTYNSLAHKGYPVEEKKASFQTHIAGPNIKLPKGYRIWQAYYSLRGGLKAQKKFFEIRTKEYTSKYHLYFSEKTLDDLSTISYHHQGQHEMLAKDRNWIKQPERAGTTEYISSKSYTLNASESVAEDGPESEEETVPPVPIPSSPDSLPNSEFDLNCRCGMTGNGNVVYHQEDGEVVQCNECRDWSHIACQRDGRATNLPKNRPFFCDTCDVSIIKHMITGTGTRSLSQK
jgi:hypothetical protein